jgi:regulator of vacuolar morphogenesis
MSRKRRNTSSPEPDDSPQPKRLRAASSSDDEEVDFDDLQDVREQPSLNQESGLRYAFPGLGGDSDELYYGPAADGIDYLRMVR